MKYLYLFLLLNLFGLSIQSCKEDEGKLPDIEFITGTGYTSSDTTVTAGAHLTIGIHATKTEEEDVLKHYSLSESVNGGESNTILEENLTGAHEDEYEVEYEFTVPPDANVTRKLTFTITNRDGLSNQVSLTLTVI